MKKLFNRHSKIPSQKMVVRPYVSWPHRLMMWAMIGLFLLALSWGMYEAGKQTGKHSKDDAVQLNSEIWHDITECAKKDGEALCAQLAELTRQFQILQKTSDDLVKETKQLSKENSQLKGELDFFEHVMAGNTKIDNDVTIHLFNLKKDNKPDLYRYSLSLVQGGPRAQEFNGYLKFLVNLKQNNQRKKVMLTNKNAQQNFSVSFKFYHRIEENFRVPPGAEVESIEVQVFEQNDSQARLTKTTELSQ